MDLEQFDYADMNFKYYENGFFFFEGVHEEYKIRAAFKPSENFSARISASENFRDMGWAWIQILDKSGTIVYKSQP